MFDLELTWDRPTKLNSQHAHRRDSNHVLRVRIIPRNLPSLPLRMAIALDTSQSMTGEKLQRAKEACLAVVSQLRNIDRLSLAAYSTQYTPLLQALTGGDEAVTLAEKAIAELQAGGVTRMDLALNWMEKSLPPEECTPLVGILITDGHATNGAGIPLDDVSFLIEKAQKMRSSDITLDAVGLGTAAKFNTSFLTDLSKEGGGTFIYADAPDKLSQDLQDRLTAYQTSVAVDAKLRLIPASGVKFTGYCRLRPEYLALEETDENELNLGIIRSDSPTDILIGLEIPSLDFGEPLGSRDMISVELTAACGLETPISKTAAITYTTSYNEAQQVNQEVNLDRLYWEIKLYNKELIDIGDNDPKRTEKLLTNIQLTATEAGETDLAKQAEEQLEAWRQSGKLNPDKATGMLRDSMNLGKKGIGYDPIPGVPKFTQNTTAQLKLLNGSGAERRFPLNPVKTVIGRNDPPNSTVDIDLTDCHSNSSTVSRRHAEIWWEQEKLQIVDLGSGNGTFVNGEKLSPVKENEPPSPVSLEPGSQVKFGDLKFEVIIDE
jgi:FOG: FHA domain